MRISPELEEVLRAAASVQMGGTSYEWEVCLGCDAESDGWGGEVKHKPTCPLLPFLKHPAEPEIGEHEAEPSSQKVEIPTDDPERMKILDALFKKGEKDMSALQNAAFSEVGIFMRSLIDEAPARREEKLKAFNRWTKDKVE